MPKYSTRTPYLLLLIALFLLTTVGVTAAGEGVQTVNVPVGKSSPAPLGQYDSYVTSFPVQAGDKLSIAFGVGELENVFVGVGDAGIALPAAGNVSLQLKLWRIGSGVNQSYEAPVTSAVFAWLTNLGTGQYQLSITNFSAEFSITPGLVLVHKEASPLFKQGQRDRGQGLVALANGNPNQLAAALKSQAAPSTPAADDSAGAASDGVNSADGRKVHLFDKPRNSATAAPIRPGQQYEIKFTAQPGDHLSFATMLVETNDFFFSFNEWGQPLYDKHGQPRTALLTKHVSMWDAGTEFDERPGSGDSQPARQPSPNYGQADANRSVRFANDKYGPIPLAGVEDIIDVFLKPTGLPNQFVLQITNVSGSKTLSPGIVLIHRDHAPLFLNGLPDYGDGLEALAEDGNPWPLSRKLSSRYD